MTSLTRSSITGLYHPRRSDSGLNKSSTEGKISAVDRLLNADKPGFLSNEFLPSSWLSQSNTKLDLSTSLSNSMEKSILEVQIKRALSSSDLVEKTIKRIRTEADSSIEDLRNHNQTLEWKLNESKMKITELEILMEQSKKTMHSNPTHESIDNDKRVRQLENENAQLKLRCEDLKITQINETTELNKTINSLKHQLVDSENQIRLMRLDRERIESLHQRKEEEILQKNIEIDQLQNHLSELESMLAKRSVTKEVVDTVLDDVKRLSDLRYENEHLKKEIELLKLKCNERTTHEDEVRTLRRQVEMNQEYRLLIAKQQQEIMKLHEQLNILNTSS